MKFRLLPFDVADGARNMAADEALLLTALPSPHGTGQASIRFYGWTEPTVSLGYFQPGRTRQFDPRLSSLPWVRRPTGGAMLVHHFELTYALAVPLVADKRDARSWMIEMHRIVTSALDDFGLAGQFASASSAPAEQSSLCFKQPTTGDLLHGRHKLLGSSQRKHHRALLQHGALLLAQSPYTPTLPGIRELTGVDLDAKVVAAAVVEAFRKMTGADVDAAAWSVEEEETVAQLAAGKYGCVEWNEKR